ncbi:hypothetical protein ACTFIZ_007632 [Dictyostelium cf. discoideum]
MDFSQITNKSSFCDNNYFNTGIVLDELKVVKEIAKGYDQEAQLIKSSSISDQYNNLNVIHQNGIKWIKIDNELKIIVSQIDEVIQLVISSYHDSALAGHWSIRKTTELVKRNFFWYGMVEDINHYCKSCKVCLCATDAHQKTMGLYLPSKVPVRCFMEINMDFIFGLDACTADQIEYTRILVIVDRLSKFVVLIPIPTHTTSIQVINLIQDQVFFTFGMPSVIISDNDPLFTSTSWKRWIEANNIIHNTCLPYHHQGNGQAEIMVRIVSNSLRKCLINSKFVANPDITFIELNDIQNDWVGYLKSVQFCINNMVSEITSLTPFQVLTGSHARSPISLVLQYEDDKHSRSLGLDKKSYCEFIQHKLNILDKVQQNLVDSIERSRHQYNKNKSPNILVEGDNVYLQELNTGAHPIRKLDIRRAGPYTVPKLLEKGNVMVRLLKDDEVKDEQVVHISRLTLVPSAGYITNINQSVTGNSILGVDDSSESSTNNQSINLSSSSSDDRTNDHDTTLNVNNNNNNNNEDNEIQQQSPVVNIQQQIQQQQQVIEEQRQLLEQVINQFKHLPQPIITPPQSPRQPTPITSSTITNTIKKTLQGIITGIHKLRPSYAKYKDIWDASKVIKYLSTIKIIPKLTYTALLNKEQRKDGVLFSQHDSFYLGMKALAYNVGVKK